MPMYSLLKKSERFFMKTRAKMSAAMRKRITKIHAGSAKPVASLTMTNELPHIRVAATMSRR